MVVRYELMDRRSDMLEARCAIVEDEPSVWRVEFWGPKGLRHIEPRMYIDPSAAHKQVLQDFVTKEGLTSTIFKVVTHEVADAKGTYWVDLSEAHGNRVAMTVRIPGHEDIHDHKTYETVSEALRAAASLVASILLR